MRRLARRLALGVALAAGSAAAQPLDPGAGQAPLELVHGRIRIELDDAALEADEDYLLRLEGDAPLEADPDAPLLDQAASFTFTGSQACLSDKV